MTDDRPQDVELRKQAGHLEGDTIIGKNNKGAILTNVERRCYIDSHSYIL